MDEAIAIGALPVGSVVPGNGARGVARPKNRASFHEAALLDAPADPAFDRLARLAATVLGAPAALVSLVDADRHSVKGVVGLPEPWVSDREGELSQSVRQHLVSTAAPLVLEDARGHPLVCDHPVLKDLDVAAYAGVPLVLETGHVLGSFCVIDTVRREWTANEIAMLTDLATLAVTEAELRLVAAEAEQARKDAAAAVARERAARALAEAAQAAAEAAQGVVEVASRAKTQFLTTMSHELRTPLNAIGGHAQLIELGIHGPVTDAQIEALSRIQKSSAHLLGLINNVLNMTSLGAGKVFYASHRASLALVLGEVEGMVAPQMTARGLIYEQEECTPALAVLADPEKVRQILINLLTNAMKFTERGGHIAVECGQTPIGTAPKRTWVRVRDTGIGIAADKLAAIFEPFVQVDTRLSRTNEGVGLGLAISRELARLMGGDLTVESHPARGSVFTLMLPSAH